MQPEGRETPQRSNACPTRPRGMWVVVALVLLGLLAAGGTLSYWRAQGHGPAQRDGPTQWATRQGAGSAPWNQSAADAELDALKRTFEQVVEDNRPPGPLLDAARRVVERYPRYAAARTFLGQVCYYQGDVEQAYAQFELSLDLDGQQPEVHLLSGTIAYKLDRIDAAAGHYSRAVGLDPSNARYRLHLAQAHIRQQRDQEARNVLLEALHIDSHLHQGYAMLADLYAQRNQLSLAIAQIQKAIDHTPISERDQQVLYIRRMAQLLRRDNQPEAALLALQGIGARTMTDPALLEEMATCWSLMGKPDRAAEVYEEAMALDPTQWTLVAGAARWRTKAGDTATARRHLDLLRRINPRAQQIRELEKQIE